MVGSAIVRQLAHPGIVLRTAMSWICSTGAVQAFFAGAGIDRASSGGGESGRHVANNTYPADFIYENMMIESNIIHAARTCTT